MTLLEMAKALVSEGVCSTVAEAYCFLEDMGLDETYSAGW